MNKKFHIIAILALSLAIISVLTSCNKKSATTAEKGVSEQILHLGNGTEPQDLDPHIVTGVPEHNLLSSIFEGLVAEDPVDLHPVPGMAESWTVSEDQKTYTFKLRQNAKWSNGEPLTSQDFVYSWNRALAPGLAGEYAYMLYYVQNATEYNTGKITDFSQVGVQAVDPQTLVVTLANPTPFFLHILQHYVTWPVHKATIEKFGKMDTRGTPWTKAGNIVTNGPFTLKTWELNKIIIVAKNPNYWDAGTVKLNEIHFHPIDSEQTEEKNFRAGELHVTNTVPIQKIEVYKKESPDFIRIDPYLGTYFYRINTTKAPMNDKRVRKALNLAIDRNLIVEKVVKGGQLPAVAFTPPNTAGYTANPVLKTDIVEAKRLLAEAGYPDGANWPGIDILYNTSESHKIIAEAVQQMWKQNLGINVTLSNQEWKVYLDTTKNLNYGISRAGWIGDYPDPNTFLDMWLTGGGNNQTGWTNVEYDRLISEAGKTADMPTRFDSFHKAEDILMEELPVIPIYVYTRIKLIAPTVKNWHPNILDHHPYKFVYLSADGNAVASK